jgi:hypothetical protein
MMNVNDLVDAFGLPRYYAEKLVVGASITATVRADGSVKITIDPPWPHDGKPLSALPVIEHTEQKRGPGRPRKIVSE